MVKEVKEEGLTTMKGILLAMNLYSELKPGNTERGNHQIHDSELVSSILLLSNQTEK
jgi:hypothetical protein